MANFYDQGERVKWKWGNGFGEGEVQTRFEEKVTRTISGSEVTRNGSNALLLCGSKPLLCSVQSRSRAILERYLARPLP